MLRKSALIVVAVVAVLGGLVAWLGLGGFAETLVEKGLSRLFRSEVALRGMSVSLFEQQGGLESLRIASDQAGAPPKVSGGPAGFQLDPLQVFAGKLVIDTLKMENLALGIGDPVAENAPAGTEGAGTVTAAGGGATAGGSTEAGAVAGTAPTEKPSAGERLRRGLGKAGGKLAGLDSGVLSEELGVSESMLSGEPESVKAYDEAIKLSKAHKASFQKSFEEARLKEQARTVKAEASALRKAKYKTAGEARVALKKAQDLNKSVAALNAEISTLQQEGTQGYQAVQAAFDHAEVLRKQDMKEVDALIGMKDLDRRQIGRLLFGRSVISKFDEVLGYMAKAREVLNQVEKQPPPGRGMGREFTFPLTRSIPPTFLVRTAALSGRVGGSSNNPDYTYKAMVNGLTTSPAQYEEPLRFQADLLPQNTPKAWQVAGVLDYRTTPSEEVIIRGKGMDLGVIRLAGEKGAGWVPGSFHSKQADLSISVKMMEDTLDATLNMKAGAITFNYGQKAASGGAMAKEMRAFFAGVNTMALVARMHGPLEDPAFEVSTDLDDRFSKRLKEVSGARAKEAKARARAALQAKTDAKRKEARAALDDSKAAMQKGLNGAKGEVKSATGEIDAGKAAIQKQIKDKGKDVGKKLKKLFG